MNSKYSEDVRQLTAAEIAVITGSKGEWECICGNYISPCTKIPIDGIFSLLLYPILRIKCEIEELPTSMEHGNGCFNSCDNN